MAADPLPLHRRTEVLQFAWLAPQPLMGRARAELAHGLRSFPFGRHAVFCWPIERGIDVVRGGGLSSKCGFATLLDPWGRE